MSKNKIKYEFWKGQTTSSLEAATKQNYINKYYNIWLNYFKWDGLDDQVRDQQINFIMRKLWADGTIAAFPIRNTDMMGFANYSSHTLNMYGFDEEVNLVNENCVSERIIPNSTLVVNKDVVLGWAQPNHKGIKTVVDYYIDRMVQVDMVINTNLQLSKMPFLVAVSEEDTDKMKDLVNRILNNEVVVFADLEHLANIQSLATSTPYIIDKLMAHHKELETELLTYLGIDTNEAVLEKTHISSDAINANNSLINAYGEAIEGEVAAFVERINKIFGRNIKICRNIKQVCSIHEEDNLSKEEQQNDDN